MQSILTLPINSTTIDCQSTLRYKEDCLWLDFIAKMSQGQVNDIMTDAQFLGFKNDRGVIPLCYDFACKNIKII